MLISGGYNWVDVRDVAAAAIQAMEKGRKGEKYILSGWLDLLFNVLGFKPIDLILSKNFTSVI